MTYNSAKQCSMMLTSAVYGLQVRTHVTIQTFHDHLRLVPDWLSGGLMAHLLCHNGETTRSEAACTKFQAWMALGCTCK